MSLLLLKKVSKKYGGDAVALEDVSFELTEGEFAALAGPSGSGKTTLLNLAAGLDHPTDGEVTFLGKTLKSLSPEALARIRRKSVGFVFQSYNLFPVLTALENVEYPLALNDVLPARRKRLAQEALEEVGLGKFARRFPSELSGGQQQRVAIARAIVTGPKIVFADEPTANLDSATAEKLLVLFRSLNETKGITFLFSSHDSMVLAVAKRILSVKDGRIVSDKVVSTGPMLVRPVSDVSELREPSMNLSGATESQDSTTSAVLATGLRRSLG